MAFLALLGGCIQRYAHNTVRKSILSHPYKTGKGSISPDGRKVVYVDYSYNVTITFPVMKRPDGSVIGEPSPPINRKGNLEIFVAELEGGRAVNPLNLTRNPAPDGEPAWSPDGTKIAFCSMRDGPSEVYVMNADGSDPRRLTNSPAYKYRPIWLPQGKLILCEAREVPEYGQKFTVNECTYIIRADGSGYEVVPDIIDEAKIAFSTKKIKSINDQVKAAFTTSDKLVVLDLSRGYIKIIPFNSKGTFLLAWSADGLVLFTAQKDERGNRQYFKIGEGDRFVPVKEEEANSQITPTDKSKKANSPGLNIILLKQ